MSSWKKKKTVDKEYVVHIYLVVIRAVGAEIRLRTEHLVHHIQAAHGEEITEKNQASFRAQVCPDGEKTVIPAVKDTAGCRESLCCAALLCSALFTHWTAVGRRGEPFHTLTHTQPDASLPPIRGQSSTLLPQ